MALINLLLCHVFCKECRYAIEKSKKILGFVPSLNEKHKNEFGKVCSCSTLKRYSLGYKFKTDVIKIKINKSLLSDEKQDEAYSILQALILASCKELNIDNNEIAGCLQYNKTDENYSYILYDVTPGGAGHVKRLNNDYTIQNVLKNALNSTKNCPNCDEDSSCYSCLRTYQNQKNHDILKRKYVFKYLGQILND